MKELRILPIVSSAIKKLNFIKKIREEYFLTPDLKFFFLFSVFADFMMFYPFYCLMFIENGLTVFQVGLSLGCFQFGKVLFDLPIGIIGDTFGRKYPFILSQGLRIIMLIQWLYYPSNFTFMLGMFFFGISASCLFGNTESYIYGVIKNFVLSKGKNTKYNLSTLFSKYIGFIYAVQNASIAISSFLASILFRYIEYKGVLLFSLLFSTIALFYSLSLSNNDGNKENRVEIALNNNIGINFSSYFRLTYGIVKDTLAFLRGEKEILYAGLWFIVHSGLYSFMIDLHSMSMINIGYIPSKIAIIIAITTGIKIIINLIIYELGNFFNYKNIFIVDFAGLLLLFLSTLFGGCYIITAISIFLISFSFSDIALISIMQKKLKEKSRTIISSGSGILTSLFVIIFQQIGIGNLGSKIKYPYGIQFSFLIAIFILIYCASKLRFYIQKDNS